MVSKAQPSVWDDDVMREKITLHNEMETLLIPLYGRAMRSEQGVFRDKYAFETIQKIDYDFSNLRIPEKVQILMSIRSAIIEDYTKWFLQCHSQTMVISLGSGLDARYARVNGYKTWIDLDFPQVIELREKLLPKVANHQSISSSVTEWQWLDGVHCSNEKVLILAEGLLMYLKEEEIQKLFAALVRKMPNATFVFDAYSLGTVKKTKWQTSLRKTGATIYWGMNSPNDLTRLNPNLKYEKTIYLTDKKYIKNLSGFYKCLFHFAGRFHAAREAHRVFVFHGC